MFNDYVEQAKKECEFIRSLSEADREKYFAEKKLQEQEKIKRLQEKENNDNIEKLKRQLAEYNIIVELLTEAKKHFENSIGKVFDKRVTEFRTDAGEVYCYLEDGEWKRLKYYLFSNHYSSKTYYSNVIKAHSAFAYNVTEQEKIDNELANNCLTPYEYGKKQRLNNNCYAVICEREISFVKEKINKLQDLIEHYLEYKEAYVSKYNQIKKIADELNDSRFSFDNVSSTEMWLGRSNNNISIY